MKKLLLGLALIFSTLSVSARDYRVFEATRLMVSYWSFEERDWMIQGGGWIGMGDDKMVIGIDLSNGDVGVINMRDKQTSEFPHSSYIQTPDLQKLRKFQPCTYKYRTTNEGFTVTVTIQNDRSLEVCFERAKDTKVRYKANFKQDVNM